MRLSKTYAAVFGAALATAILFYACKSPQKTTAAKPPQARILVFSKTAGFYHNSIPDGIAAIQKLGAENGFGVDTTKDAAYFNDDSLKNYNAVVFLSTTMNVLNADQQVAFERYIQAGGGFAGVHAAADTEYDWPWYNKLVGAWFASHPRQQNAAVDVLDSAHISTSFLPRRWQRYDEWYNYKDINPDIKVLANLDESTYEGGANGDNHPIAWYHEFDGGRSWYTGMGHTKESFTEPLFVKHLLGGIQYAMGNGKSLDYSKAYAVKRPEDNRFTKTILSNDLNEPMELAVAPDGRVFFTERAGNFYVYDPKAKQTKLLHRFNTKAVEKYLNGLIGITLDPAFAQNRQLYVFYSSNTGENYHQNVSRFTLTTDGALDTTSEKIIIQVPIDLEVSAHTGGSLAWDKHNNLFISTGDNTVPFESDGYAPIDEREGRKTFDAQRSAGNPNDLRGKVLRIHPEPDGSYTIPDGNLFPKGTTGTRPEIYVMGCRNPYRIAVDTATSILYWGEIGPDAGRDSRHGPRGYDEFNQAKKPGNYGWPYFVGNTKAYNDSNFATKEVGPLFNAAAPVNESVNNTGIKNLPPAQPAMIWYPYNRSEEFPELNDGGRCAMGGPVYHYSAAHTSATKLPAYYDKAMFVYDWMRNWVFAVRFDEANNYKRMERFMQTNGDFRRPVDMEIGPDGVMYMLEYGSVYGIDNEDARLVRIDFNEGNRAPVAQINIKDSAGSAPFTVQFDGRKSFDVDDEDALTYQWSFGDGNASSTEAKPTFSFAHAGLYKTVLTVTDKAGLKSTDTANIYVGNTAPVVNIQSTNNSSFFFPKTTGLKYSVNVADKEDGTIDPSKIDIGFRYIPRVATNTNVAGHQQLDENYNFGKNLVASSDCKACHQLNAKSVGPSFVQVSQKYKADKNAVAALANKVITGGGGVWGEHAMNAHPQLSKEDAMEMVKYVLSVSEDQASEKLGDTGTLYLQQHMGTGERGRYLLTASYTDKGGAAVPLTGKSSLTLRPSRVQAEDADKVYNISRGDRGLQNIHNGSYFVLNGIDLKEITGLTYRYSSFNRNSSVKVRLDSAKGPTISTVELAPTGNWNTYMEVKTEINDPGGKHDLYFVFVQNDTPNRNLANLDWVRFEGGTEVQPQPKSEPKKIVVKNAKLPKAAPDKLVDNKTATAGTANIKAGGALIAKNDCKTCHAIDKRVIGPSYQEVAAKYKATPSIVSTLANHVINGSQGVWGQLPMTPHPQLSKKDAETMVQYILSLRKK